MNDNLNKPITIVRAEFISNIANLINNSTLPPFIIEDILKGVYLEIKDVVRKQYELDVKKYEESKHSSLIKRAGNEGDSIEQ